MLARPEFDPKSRLLLRERVLLYGAEALGDVELVAVLLGTGAEGEPVLGMAARLLDAAGGPDGIGRLGAHGLSEQRGVGPAKAARLLAAVELGRRAAMKALSDAGETLCSFDSVVEWARPRLAALDYEEVWLLGLDGRNVLRTARRVARGGAHGCAVLPRDILRPALRDGASAIILLHNHPSGDPTPSSDDIVMTRALAVACDAVGVALLDHVIVARGGASSLRESDVIR
jgi:DNA repair protein RadC